MLDAAKFASSWSSDGWSVRKQEAIMRKAIAWLVATTVMLVAGVSVA